MKQNMTTKFFLIAVALTAIYANAYSACDPISNKVDKTKAAIENLKLGIKSENNGLRRSSIYMVGKYKLSELKNELMEQLKKETFPSNRILIALSLYQIGEADGIDLVKTFAEKDNDQKVRRMCTAIYNEYLKVMGIVQISEVGK
ncbi:MAG: HEAT repeat domain-containing protein [Ignavibacteriales bacterium]|nr:HEAT repeat domain-containing protein [Ignavibacteriales bacterium]